MIRRAVRAAAIMTEGELFDQEHRLAPPGQTIGGGRTHGPRTNDHVPGGDALHAIEFEGSGAQAEYAREAMLSAYQRVTRPSSPAQSAIKARVNRSRWQCAPCPARMALTMPPARPRSSQLARTTCSDRSDLSLNRTAFGQEQRQTTEQSEPGVPGSPDTPTAPGRG